MLNPEQLHGYQKTAIELQCSSPSSMMWLDVGLGKLQPNSEPVLTPNGWVNMGDIKVGMYVVGSDGQPTEVLGVFPQGEQSVVRVTLSDGSWCRVGWDHLWYVQTRNQRTRDQVGHVMTTRQIVDKGICRQFGKRELYDFCIPMVEPVNYQSSPVQLDPYILGVILGDGTTSPSGDVTVCTDRDIINSSDMLRYLRDHKTCDYVGYGSLPGKQSIIKSLGLNGKRSWEKFIPSNYMTAQINDRLAMVQGLMDSDGSPIDKGGAEFSSTSEQLTDGLVELVESLGGNARKKGPRITRYQNGEGRPSWRVNVKLPSSMEPFRLQRKLDKWVRPTKYQPMRYIVDAVDEGVEESTCIKVAAKDSLYVTRHHVVTHNTSVALTSIAHLIDTGWLDAVFVVAPIRVCRLVWAKEASKWSHTNHLKFSMVMGTKDQRLRALHQKADVYLINYENLRWLMKTLKQYYVDKGKPLPANGIVWDEISKMKNSSTQRVKAVRHMLKHFKWFTGLTATPASNGYKDLHGQFLVVDQGQRLGTAKSQFEGAYFKKVGYKLVPHEDAKEAIHAKISDITLEMSAADYNPLPDMIVNDIEVELPPSTRLQYDQLEKDYFTKLDTGEGVEVFNAASLTNKLLQMSNGCVYPIPGAPMYQPVHDAKLDALEDLVEELSGQQLLLSYAYRSDADRIMRLFNKVLKDSPPINLTECKTERSLKQAMLRWDTGDCPLMIGHPACLHPMTQVLTELYGWISLIDVSTSDKVFDGVEFVSHDGCSYSGYKDVIDVFGITMTQNHKLLINNNWVEAHNVGDSEAVRREALYEYKGYDDGVGEMFEMRDDIENYQTELHQAQPDQERILSALCSGQIPQYDWDSYLENLARDDSRRGDERRDGLTLRKREASNTKTHVYDLVNCGPRNRFIIRNGDGEAFISHNSMGHGIDGLQDAGHNLCWFGMNWSLDFYEQFNGRLRRQGQGAPVKCHRIIAPDTMDMAQIEALNIKSSDQASLRKAVATYRNSRR